MALILTNIKQKIVQCCYITIDRDHPKVVKSKHQINM
jgi:hypothetical protein